MKKLMIITSIMLYLGCASAITPQYTVIEASGKSPGATQEALPVEGGWEFQFPKRYNVQKVTINHDGVFTQLNVYAKMEGRWKQIQSVEISPASPSEIALNVTTDGIRIFPQPAKAGHITFCRFYMKKIQKIFSIPLEKPPFVK